MYFDNEFFQAHSGMYNVILPGCKFLAIAKLLTCLYLKNTNPEIDLRDKETNALPGSYYNYLDLNTITWISTSLGNRL